MRRGFSREAIGVASVVASLAVAACSGDGAPNASSDASLSDAGTKDDAAALDGQADAPTSDASDAANPAPPFLWGVGEPLVLSLASYTPDYRTVDLVHLGVEIQHLLELHPMVYRAWLDPSAFMVWNAATETMELDAVGGAEMLAGYGMLFKKLADAGVTIVAQATPITFAVTEEPGYARIPCPTEPSYERRLQPRRSRAHHDGPLGAVVPRHQEGQPGGVRLQPGLRSRGRGRRLLRSRRGRAAASARSRAPLPGWARGSHRRSRRRCR